MPLFRKLATLAGAAEAARRYAKKNPDKAARFVDQAAQFVDKQTKGRYSGQIDGAARKVKDAAGAGRPGQGRQADGYPGGYGTDRGRRPGS
ncbi:antitoxin [Pseudonocardia acidicola]|uniref:Antitoxin n=1 Tax=Pseudonocardia acidicola TaxID=2724939 RepID=A0ABX1SBL7_9PSEU|nr:antitoxin [Pseudonocardia acidicola]NMH98960.1 antitoxin [Pseudonocardia acidicola]